MHYEQAAGRAVTIAGISYQLSKTAQCHEHEFGLRAQLSQCKSNFMACTPVQPEI